MDLHERLRASEQSRRLAWRVLQEIRLVLEILGDQRIPCEGEMKRFRAEGDFLVRALVNLVPTNRSHIHRLEPELGEFAKLADDVPDVPRELLKGVQDLNRHPSNVDLYASFGPFSNYPMWADLSNPDVYCLGRLKQNVTPATAAADLKLICNNHQ